MYSRWKVNKWHMQARHLSFLKRNKSVWGKKSWLKFSEFKMKRFFFDQFYVFINTHKNIMIDSQTLLVIRQAGVRTAGCHYVDWLQMTSPAKHNSAVCLRLFFSSWERPSSCASSASQPETRTFVLFIMSHQKSINLIVVFRVIAAAAAAGDSQTGAIACWGALVLWWFVSRFVPLFPLAIHMQSEGLYTHKPTHSCTHT